MKEQSFGSITYKTVIVHTATYFMMGLFALIFFDYTSKFENPIIANYMRQTNDPLVAAGPLFQVIRGFLFGLVFYSLRELVFTRKNGWLVLWLTLVVVGVLSPFGAAPSSIEGMIYTTLPMWFHITGLPEVLIQAFLLAYVTYYWVNHPEKKWIGWVLGIIFVLVILMSTLGILAGLGILQVPA